jgi:hypothetical protein
VEDLMTPRPTVKKATPEAQLKSLIAKREPAHQTLIRAVRTALRKRLPTANEMVYDYGRSLVISYSPSEHGIEGIVSTAARAGGVDLYFNQGHRLPDPKKLLQGSATQVRFITLGSARQVAHPDVEALIAGAIKLSATPLPRTGRGSVIIRTDGTQKKKKATKKSAARKPAK